MKWWNGFGRSLAFAAVAAAACPLYLAFAGLLLGWKLAMATYVVALAALYVLGIASRPARGLAAAAGVVLCGLAMLALGASGVGLAFGVAALLGALRSGLLCRGRAAGGDAFARRLAIEVGLLGGGLALAFHLGRSALAPEALAVWGFFMAQSAFFLIGGAEARAARRDDEAAPDVDPFERAVRRAAALLDETV